MLSWWDNIKYSVSGSNRLDITALQKSQAGDAMQFQKISDLLEGLQKSQTGDATQFQEISDLLKKLQESQIGDAKQFEEVQKYLDGLQEKVEILTEKVETLTETVGEQEKIMATCIIVSAVAAIAITSFVAFCIYQGIKCEREKEKNLSQDTPGTKLDADGGKLNDLEVNGLKSVNDIAA